MLKATADHLRQRPDLAHVWRNIDDEIDMDTAWDEPDGRDRRPRARRSFVVQQMSHAGHPGHDRQLRGRLVRPDRLVRDGRARRRSSSATSSYRIPPLTDSDAADLVRDVKAAPLFFGYNGSEAIDVAAVEELIQRLARLKDDLPEVQELELGLVLAGRDGAEVLRATGRISPCSYARSDWYTRRLGGPSGTEDTLVD